MGNFKEGQYVVATRKALHIEKGDIVQVERYARPTALGDWLMIKGKRNDTDDGSYEERDFSAWTPKVGERVVEAEPKQYDFVAHWRDFWQGAEGPIVDDAFVVTKVSGNFVHYSNRVGGNGPQATLDCFEPLPVAAEAQPAAAMKIEAGRYYKTRDGRRVGPMRDDGCGLFGAEGFNFKEWYDNGRCYSDLSRTTPKDLIAELQVTPSAPVAAQVDTINEEYGPVAREPRPWNRNPKFKVGDRVRVVCNKTNGGDPIRQYAVGGVYPITSIVKDLNGNDAVVLDNHHQYIKQGQFSLATTAIVALIEDGQPKPADRPYIHTSEEAAATEAKRLAGIHKGKQFGVFVLTTTAEEAKPTYSHEWQRLAADGQKIAAIKELRSLTGMMLKPARDVVEHFIDYPYGQAA